MFTKQTDYPFQHPHLHRRIGVPVGQLPCRTIRVHFLRGDYPVAFRTEFASLQAKPSQIVQFDTDGKAVQAFPAGITAASGMPRLHMERNKLEDSAVPTDDQMRGSLYLRADKIIRRRRRTHPRRIMQYDHIGTFQAAGILRTGEVHHPLAHQAMVDYGISRFHHLRFINCKNFSPLRPMT